MRFAARWEIVWLCTGLLSPRPDGYTTGATMTRCTMGSRAPYWYKYNCGRLSYRTFSHNPPLTELFCAVHKLEPVVALTKRWHAACLHCRWGYLAMDHSGASNTAAETKAYRHFSQHSRAHHVVVWLDDVTEAKAQKPTVPIFPRVDIAAPEQPMLGDDECPF